MTTPPPTGLGNSQRRTALTTQFSTRAFSMVVLCMTESHRAMIQLQFERVPKHLYLFRQFLPPPVDPEVDDPYGGPLSVYETCRDNLVEAVPSVVNLLKVITAAP